MPRDGAWSWVLAAAVACAACGRSVDVLWTDAAVDQSDGVTTWFEDVAPIYARACWTCHLADDPVPLVELEDAAALATESLRVAAASTHPADFDESCSETLAGDEHFSASELAILSDWIASGLSPGDPARGPVPPTSVLAARAELVMSYGLPPPPADGVARCLLIETVDPTARFVTGLEVRGGAGTVRFVMLFGNEAQGRDDAERQIDLGDDGSTYPCGPDSREVGAPPLDLQTVGAPTRWGLAVAAPGLPHTDLPAGAGVARGSGAAPFAFGFVARIEYVPGAEASGPPAVLGVAFASAAEHPWYVAGFADEPGLALSPGDASFETVTESVSLLPVDVQGVLVLGGPLLREVRLDSDESCAVGFTSWEGAFARAAFFASPARLGSVRLRTEHDTSDARSTLLWGNPPEGEYCLAALFLPLP